MTVHSWVISFGRLEVFTLQFPTILVCLHHQGLHTRDFTKIATSRTTLWAITSLHPCDFHCVVPQARKQCCEHSGIRVASEKSQQFPHHDIFPEKANVRILPYVIVFHYTTLSSFLSPITLDGIITNKATFKVFKLN